MARNFANESRFSHCRDLLLADILWADAASLLLCNRILKRLRYCFEIPGLSVL